MSWSLCDSVRHAFCSYLLTFSTLCCLCSFLCVTSIFACIISLYRPNFHLLHVMSTSSCTNVQLSVRAMCCAIAVDPWQVSSLVFRECSTTLEPLYRNVTFSNPFICICKPKHVLQGFTRHTTTTMHHLKQHTDIQAYRHTDRQTDRKTDRQTRYTLACSVPGLTL